MRALCRGGGGVSYVSCFMSFGLAGFWVCSRPTLTGGEREAVLHRRTLCGGGLTPDSAGFLR